MEEEKIYIDAREYLRDSWRLAKMVLEGQWRPDVLLALWRGGAPVGVAVHEYFKVCGLNVEHLPIKCSSYTGIAQRNQAVDFENFSLALKPHTRVLVVDDIFDTGNTAAAIHERLKAMECDMRMACVYWNPNHNRTEYKPDYYVRTVECWLVFPHEIEGLTPAEITKKDPVLAHLLG